MRGKLSAIRYFYYGVQMIFMTVLPFVGCFWLAGFLKERYGVGDWIVPAAAITAVLWAGADLYSFGRMFLREISRNTKDEQRK